MGLRLSLARVLLQLGSFIQSLPLVVMRPDDLVEFSRQSYARPSNVETWAGDALVGGGLSPDEQDLLATVPAKTGNLLLLGVGGGREAIPLAQMGFRVTGVDYIPAMVDRAQENAERRGVCLDGLVQEVSRLDVPQSAYEVVWLSCVAYSCVPTRARRVEMVRRIARALKPGGFFILQFHRGQAPEQSTKVRLARKLIAAFTLGNLAYEEGDMLWGNSEFLHSFPSDDALRSELEAGGLSVVRIQRGQNPSRCGAVCRKRPEMSGNARKGMEEAK